VGKSVTVSSDLTSGPDGRRRREKSIVSVGISVAFRNLCLWKLRTDT